MYYKCFRIMLYVFFVFYFLLLLICTAGIFSSRPLKHFCASAIIRTQCFEKHTRPRRIIIYIYKGITLVFLFLLFLFVYPFSETRANTYNLHNLKCIIHICLKIIIMSHRHCYRVLRAPDIL